MEYYRILGLEKNATIIEIKRAYRKMAREYHPDLNSGKDAEKHFIRIKAAYDTLCDPLKRESYDNGLSYAKKQYNYNNNYKNEHNSRPEPNSAKNTAYKKKDEPLKKADEDLSRLITFTLGKDEYALNIDQVLGIVGSATIKEPEQPNSALDGIIHTRGEDWPVIDLARSFGINGDENDGPAKIILAEIEGIKVGFLVNKVSLVTDLASAMIRDMPNSPLGDTFLSLKMAMVGERMIIILDLDHILSPAVISALRSLGQNGG